MKWYKRDPEAFAGGTAELSLEEVGAYTRVIDLIYSRDGNVPDDEMFLARALRCDVRVWRRIRARLVVTGKISTSAGLIVNLRATSEISYAQVRMKKDRKRNENKESNLTSAPILTTTTTIRKEAREDTAIAVPPPSRSPYAFESGIIRLNERDFTKWKTSFGHLDLAAELIQLTEWAETEGKNWFFAVSGALAKRNREERAKIAIGKNEVRNGTDRQERHSLRAAFDRLDAALDGQDEAGELPLPPNLRLLSGGSV